MVMAITDVEFQRGSPAAFGLSKSGAHGAAEILVAEGDCCTVV